MKPFLKILKYNFQDHDIPRNIHLEYRGLLVHCVLLLTLMVLELEKLTMDHRLTEYPSRDIIGGYGPSLGRHEFMVGGHYK